MINCRWISKQMGKTLKILWQRKNQKNRAFRTPCKNFARLAKIPNVISQGVWKFRIPYENFTRHVKNSHTHLCKKLCEIRQGVRTHFATLEKFCKLYANSNSLCENQRSLKTIFKPLQALFSFHTPICPLRKPPSPCDTLVSIVFSLLDAPRPPIWRGNPHRTCKTQTRASRYISDMARIRGGHTDSSLSRNPRPRAFSPQDSTSQAPKASTIPSSEGGVWQPWLLVAWHVRVSTKFIPKVLTLK